MTGPEASKRSARADFMSLLVGGAVALGVLQASFQGVEQEFEDLALGRDARSLFAKVGEHPIHCQQLPELEACLEGWHARGEQPAVVWLGNSQLHAVNQLADGQENAPPLLHRRLAERGLDLLAFSQPNANLQEHLALFAYLLDRVEIRRLVLGLVFDDLRETGVRWSLAGALEDPATRQRLERSEVGRTLLEREPEGAPDRDLAGLDQTIQQHSEAALTRWLDAHSTLWSLRPQARGSLFTGLYELRNEIFGITPQSKRRLIPGRAALNLAALRALLGEARHAGVAALVYVVPLRDDVETPYIEREYRAFLRDAERIADEEDADFADFADLVPADLWGMKQEVAGGEGVEIDFMHFQAGGHALLADAVGDRLEALEESSR